MGKTERRYVLSRKLFIGTEAEGPGRGKQTLFVGSHDVTNERILSAIHKYSIPRIYFGADNVYGISNHSVTLLPLLLEMEIQILLEIIDTRHLEKIPRGVLQRIEPILVIHNNWHAVPENFRIKHLKMVYRDRLQWLVCRGGRYITTLNDSLYLEDKEV